MLLNVLEHLRDPFATLKLIKSKLLAKNGLLVIEVPNDFNDFQQVANKEFDLDNWWVVSPNHINYFSPKTLFRLLDKCGYTVFEYPHIFFLWNFSFYSEIIMLITEILEKYVMKKELSLKN